MRTFLILGAVVLAAGCLAPAESPLAPVLSGDAGGATVRHTATTILPLDPSAPDVVVRLARTGFVRTEPTLGITSTGAIFLTAGDVLAAESATRGIGVCGAAPCLGVAGVRSSLARSLDGAKTWVTTEHPVMGPKGDLDPWVYVDARTDRVFHASLTGACAWMEWSDDEGATWDFSLTAGCGHFGDHDYEKITAGPAPDGVETNGYDDVVYYTFNGGRREFSDESYPPAAYVSVSLDGGRSFGPSVRAHFPDPCGSGFGAPIAVAPDGTAYSALAGCEGVAVARSRDAGATWEQVGSVPYPAVDGSNYGDSNIAIDSAGRLFMTSIGGDGVRFATSADGGATWTENRRLAPPLVRAGVFALNAAGASGRFAVAYLGTESDPLTWSRINPSEAPADTAWHLYLTTTEDAFAPDPVWTTTRVTPLDDPVQRGHIWLRGATTPPPGGQNLGDFISMVQHDGRVFVAYADGCDRCASSEASTRSDVVVAVVESGPSLLGGVLAPLDGDTP